MQMESKLTDMIGKLYLYNLKEHRVIRFKCETTFSKLVTDKDDIVIHHDTAGDILDKFLFVEEEGVGRQLVIEHHQAMPAHLPTNSIQERSAQLMDIVMSNIEKVKESADFIPQANAINDQLKSIIELGKTEVEMIKAQAAFSRFSNGGGF